MLQPLMIIIAMPQPAVIDVRMLEGGSGGKNAHPQKLKKVKPKSMIGSDQREFKYLNI